MNTLSRYINYTTLSSGFNKGVIDKIQDLIEKITIDSKLSELQEYPTNVSLAFDQKRIQLGETSVCECFNVDLIQTI